MRAPVRNSECTPPRGPSAKIALLSGRPATGARSKLLTFSVCCLLWPLVTTSASAAETLPEIRLNTGNRVPACVTPERLMAFVATRNPRLDPRFRDLAKWYRHHGEALRVRWDYAFFQMALETNFLSYRRPDGRPGDVDPRQNNFAGIGATGGGVPGDRFPNVATGVLAQLQHLVAYSGEPLARPVAPRTQLKQDVIVAASRRLARPVRFSDLARRWAADPRYGASIAVIADSYRQAFCQRHEANNLQRTGNAGPRPEIAKSYLGGPVPPASPPAIVTPPKPQAAVRTGPASVARTVWRRGDPMPPAIAGWAVAVTSPETPAATSAAAHTTPSPPPATTGDTSKTSSSRLLDGLQAMAQSVSLPLAPPPPRLALREKKAPN